MLKIEHCFEGGWVVVVGWLRLWGGLGLGLGLGFGFRMLGWGMVLSLGFRMV